MGKTHSIKIYTKEMAMTLVGTTTAIAGAVGAQPIPIVDIPILTGMQIGMIIGIAYISGRELNKKSALEFLAAMGANVGVAFGLREVA